uniref:Uncharacterized protein n=1 Tax=Arundo donax TaxID=35708 RepID=A0A0A9AEN0_ARUDO
MPVSTANSSPAISSQSEN